MPINRSQFAKKSGKVGYNKNTTKDYFQYIRSLKKSKVDRSTRRKSHLRHADKAVTAIRAAAASRRRPRKRFNQSLSCPPVPGETSHFKERLYRELRCLLFVMLIFGQLPFYFWTTKKAISIRFRYKHPIFWLAVIICVINWMLFLWMGMGMFTVNRLNSEIEESPEKDMSHRFWLGCWMVWFVLLHLAVSSTEFVVRAEAIAKFVREMIQVMEVMKMDVTRKLPYLLIVNLVVMTLAVVAIIVLFNHADTIPWVYAVGALIIQFMARPIYNDRCHPELFDSKCNPNRYHEFAPYGLVLIIYAVIASRLYTTYFMAMCRIFRNAFNVSARRMEICLQLEPKPDDAKRTDFESMFNDYYSITTMVHKFNVIHGFSAATYFFIQLVGFLMECYNISRYFGIDPKEYHESLPTLSANTVTNIKNEQAIINFGAMYYMHLCVTFISCIYVSLAASQVYRKILEYNGVLYRRGIVGNREPLERDFVRTMWMNCSHRHPVIISPARLFGITPRFMIQFLGVTVIFLILMFPLPLLTKYEKFEEEEHHQKTVGGSRMGTHRGHTQRILSIDGKPNKTQVLHYLGDLVVAFL